jgi:hypothetical protein
MKANEIVNAINNVEWDGAGNPLYGYSQVIEAMKKIAEISFDKGEEIDYENTSARDGGGWEARIFQNEEKIKTDKLKFFSETFEL